MNQSPKPSAAQQLGVTFQHLNEVLRGRRQSRRILAAVSALPNRKSA